MNALTNTKKQEDSSGNCKTDTKRTAHITKVKTRCLPGHKETCTFVECQVMKMTSPTRKHHAS